MSSSPGGDRRRTWRDELHGALGAGGRYLGRIRSAAALAGLHLADAGQNGPGEARAERGSVLVGDQVAGRDGLQGQRAGLRL